MLIIHKILKKVMEDLKKIYQDAVRRLENKLQNIDEQQKLFSEIGFNCEFMPELGEIHITSNNNLVDFENIQKAIEIERKTNGYFQVEHYSGTRYELTEVKNSTYMFEKFIIPLGTYSKIGAFKPIFQK